MLNQVVLVGHIMSGPIKLSDEEVHNSFTHVIMVQIEDEVYPVHIWSGVVDALSNHDGELVGIKGHLMICGNGIGLGIGAEKVSLIRAED